MKIGGIQKLSMVDYPGHMCCTIFLKGCNLRCNFCHNPSLVTGCGGENETSFEEIRNFLEKRKGLLDAVCITGGEPTLNPHLTDMVDAIKNMGYKVKLDTNGTRPEVVRELIERKLLDYIAVDVKAPMNKYAIVAGCDVDTDKIKETIQMVMDSGLEYEFRTTFLPDLNAKDIKEIADTVSGSKRYIVQQFRNQTTLNEEYSSKKPYDKQYIMDIVNAISPMFTHCEARGI